MKAKWVNIVDSLQGKVDERQIIEIQTQSDRGRSHI